jgi:hypothetical protein
MDTSIKSLIQLKCVKFTDEDDVENKVIQIVKPFIIWLKSI